MAHVNHGGLGREQDHADARCRRLLFGGTQESDLIPRFVLLDVSLRVAERIATYIFDQGLARVSRPADVGSLIRS